MRLKIRCDGESEIFCKIFWELNETLVIPLERVISSGVFFWISSGVTDPKPACAWRRRLTYPNPIESSQPVPNRSECTPLPNSSHRGKALRRCRRLRRPNEQAAPRRSLLLRLRAQAPVRRRYSSRRVVPSFLSPPVARAGVVAEVRRGGITRGWGLWVAGGGYGEQQGYSEERSSAQRVADHYSARSNQTLEERESSPIIHLKKLNNWVGLRSSVQFNRPTTHTLHPCLIPWWNLEPLMMFVLHPAITVLAE